MQARLSQPRHRSALPSTSTRTVTSGGAADTLTFNKLEVDGITRLNLGDGANKVTIDDALFAGAFTLKTGAGGDVVNLDTGAGAAPSPAGRSRRRSRARRRGGGAKGESQCRSLEQPRLASHR